MTRPLDEGVVMDKYDQLMALAATFDAVGEEIRQRAALGAEVLADEGVAGSADLAPKTWRETERDVLLATSGRGGLLDRSFELDADAFVVRATVMTYQWIDELAIAAERTLGSIVGRAVGYLAPEVALGGAVVAAGLIETDALDREELAAYLNELASNNPDLMDHFTSGGGGLLDRLQLRALLTVASLGGPHGPAAARAGLRAVGAGDFAPDPLDAIRDAAGGFVDRELDADAAELEVAARAEPGGGAAPGGVEQLISELIESPGLRVRQVDDRRFIAYLPGATPRRGELRLVGTDLGREAAAVTAALEAAVPAGASLMLVGSGHGGAVVAEVAASPSEHFTVDQVVTVGAPGAQATTLPDSVRMLALEDKADPSALLASLVNARSTNRLTVVYDAGDRRGTAAYLTGGRAADAATHADLRKDLDRIRSLGYLAS